MTNYCCQSTLRDAMMLDFRPLMPPDVTAAADDSTHEAAYADLSNMGMFDLRPSGDLIAELGRAGGM